ncbi:MAG: ComEC/Rec2 family competence protein, partial [Candidatus Omnitrophica bacterium]|nr:ComEC/Rec2 family competence protein [Candidatus Omnitrophota bacterium]
MKFPFFWLSFGLTLGILVAYRSRLPANLLWPCILCAVPFLWLLRGRRSFLPLLLVTLALLGTLLFQEKTARAVNAVENWAGVKGGSSNWCSLQGVVWSQPEIKTSGRKSTLSFVLASRNLMRCGKGRCGLFETSGFVQVFIAQPPQVPEVGDLIRLRGTIEKPVPVLNPGQFDYAEYLAASDIYAIFTAYGARSLRIVKKNDLPRWRQWIAGVRQTLTRKLDRMFNAGNAATFKALILGLRKGLAPELRDDFMVTGTAHILAISGLNISLVAGSLYFAMIVMRLSQKIAALVGLLAALAYVFISGAQIPVQRAGWMAAAVFIALIFEREHQFWNSYCLSFFILLLVDPRRVVDVSFQLSFISIFALVYLMPRIFESWRWKESLGRNVGVMLGTTPVVLYYFNVFSIISLVANLVAIPLFHLGLLSCFLALLLDFVPAVSVLAAAIAARIVEAAHLWIHYLAKLEWGYLFVPTPHLLQLGIYYGSLLSWWGANRIRKSVLKWL